MLKCEVAHLWFAAGNLIHIDVFIFAAEQDPNCAYPLRARQAMEHAIGRSQNRCCPALVRKRCWQVSYDVTNAADLAALQRAVFGCHEDDVLDTDSRCPDLTREM